MPKFEYLPPKEIQNKNGKKITQTVIKATNPKNLITYNEAISFIEKLEKEGHDMNSLQVVGQNRLSFFTLKSMGQDFDAEYMRNKPKDVSSKLDGFYTLNFIVRD